MKNIAILVSGSGTNLQNIIDSIKKGEISNAKISLVVADRDCYAIERAKNHKIPSIIIKKGDNFNQQLLETIPENTDLIVLAGFLSILDQNFCNKYEGKIINLHPSLLPKFGGKGMFGKHVHQAVLDAQEKVSGATVHFVTSGIDQGDIIIQKKIKITKEDNLESLTQKIQKIEHQIFPKAINKILNKKPIVFRDATEEDLQKIVEIYNSIVHLNTITADVEPVTLNDKMAWFKEHNPQKRPLWMVETPEKNTIGWVSLQSFYGRPAYNITAEISIYLAEEYRGKGYGKEILSESLIRAKNLGLENILGYIFSSNKNSIKLFKNCGFKKWAHFPKVAVINNQYISLKILGKKL